MKKYFSYTALLFAVMLSACTKVGVKELETGCSTGYSIPICTYKAKVYDLLKGKSDRITFNNDSSINVQFYEGDSSFNLDIVSFDDCDTVSGQIDLARIFSLTTDAKIPSGTHTLLNKSFDLKLNFNEETETQSYRVDSAHFTSPKLKFHNIIEGFSLSSTNYVDIQISLVGCKDDDGNDAQMSYTYNSNQSADIEKVFTNFLAKFQSQTGNNLTMKLEYTLHSDGTQTMTTSAKMDYSYSFLTLGTVNAYGSFRNDQPVYSERYAEKVDSSLALLFEDGCLPFYNPKLTIDLEHNVGAGLKFKVNGLYIIDKSGKKYQATGFSAAGYKLGKPGRPETVGGEIDPVHSSFSFDRNNGLDNLFKGSGIPDSIVLDYSICLPSMSDTESDDYIRSGSSMSVDFDLQMKMQFAEGSYMSLVNDVPADFSDIDTVTTGAVSIDTLYVYFDFTNSIPFDLETSFSFLNAGGIPLTDSLQTVSIDACAVDEYGMSKTPSSTENVLGLAFSGSDIKKIMATKKIRFTTKLVGKKGEEKITLRASDALQAKVYVFPKFKANANGIFK